MQPSNYDIDFDFSEAPASQEQYYSSAPYVDLSQYYAEQWCSQQQPASTGYSQYQQIPGSHRRFASTSSAASGAESHLSRHPSLSYQQYPGTQPHLSPFQTSQPAPWSYDTSSPISVANNHLPTPVGTPKSDTSIQAFNARRSRGNNGRDAALAAAHSSVRSALNQQWKPDTFASPQFQSRPYSYYEMPRTPQTVNGDDLDAQMQQNGKDSIRLTGMSDAEYLLTFDNVAAASVPKLDRTVSDAQADELYNPATFSQPPTTAPRLQPQHASYLQAPPSILQDRLRDANEARSGRTYNARF